jgi:hypothetical protein
MQALQGKPGIEALVNQSVRLLHTLCCFHPCITIERVIHQNINYPDQNWLVSTGFPFFFAGPYFLIKLPVVHAGRSQVRSDYRDMILNIIQQVLILHRRTSDSVTDPYFP